MYFELQKRLLSRKCLVINEILKKMLWFFINNQLGSWFETPVETAKMDKHFQSKTIIKQAIYCIYHKTCKSDCQIKAWPHARFYWLSFDFTDIDSALACILESHVRHFWSFILFDWSTSRRVQNISNLNSWHQFSKGSERLIFVTVSLTAAI